MVAVLFATDIHGNKALCEKLFSHAEANNAEMIIGGDICPKLQQTIDASIAAQRKFLVTYLLPRIKKLARQPYIMMGNDDCRINLDVLQTAASEETIKLLHDAVHKLGPYFITGYPFVPITPFRLKDWEKADVEPRHVGGITTIMRNDYSSIRDDFMKIAAKTAPAETIYSVHTPPFNTSLDILHDGTHAGSMALRSFIEKEQPALTLHGHIHESPRMSGVQVEKLGHSVMANPGSHHHPAKPLPKKLPVAVFTTENISAVQCIEL